MKALIPAAGIGTRLRPFTNAIPKELLPIGNKAVIEHVVEALKIAGITDIIIVVSPHKPIILEYLGSGKRLGVHITYVVQDDPLGLANAVLAGKPLINTTFAVILGDNFFYPKTFIKELIEYHKEICADASIGAFEVEDVTRHGIILPKGNNVIDFIEKPRPENALSNIGDMGAYIFEPVIFDAIRKTKIGYNNEYQLTDSIKILIEEGKKVVYKKITNIHIDVGTPEDLMKANRYYLQHYYKW